MEIFGSKSEKTKVLNNQLSMFNEPEAFADPKEKEPVAKAHKSGVSAKANKVRDDALQNLPAEIQEFDLPVYRLSGFHLCDNHSEG